MAKSVAIVGAGVSGLTCGVVFAERGIRAAIFAEQIGQQTTSAAAGALWFPYDAEPAGKVIPWALATYRVLVDLSKDPRTGVSMIELRQYCRASEIQIPDWAHSLGGVATARAVRNRPQAGGHNFSSSFFLRVPLMDTTIYLNYLANRFQRAGGEINSNVRFEKLEDVDPKFDPRLHPDRNRDAHFRATGGERIEICRCRSSEGPLHELWQRRHSVVLRARLGL